MKTEELQQLVLNSLGGCSWEYDLPADDLAFSDEFFELIGYAPNEMEIDRDWVAGNIHPDDLSQWQQCYAGSIKGHSRYFDCELRFRQKNGQYVWLQTRGVVSERDAQGRALRILGMVFDISERKAGKENELLYQMFLDNIPDAISLKDLEGRFLYVNRQFQAWLGKSADQTGNRARTRSQQRRLTTQRPFTEDPAKNCRRRCDHSIHKCQCRDFIRRAR